MGRRKPEPVDPADLAPPAVIARQIHADLRAAAREIEALIRDLEPSPATTPSGGEQLAIDL